MTTRDKPIKRKLSLLELAEFLQDISFLHLQFLIPFLMFESE